MRFESYGWFLILYTVHVICDVSFMYYEYLVRGTLLESNIQDGGYCKFEPKCSCIWNADGFDYHCEDDFHLNVFFIRDGFTSVEIKCYNQSSDQYSHYNYYHLLQLDGPEILEVRFTECPEPKKSYASHIQPLSENFLSLQHATDVSLATIRTLSIDCASRQKFIIERKHLEDLSQLQILTINCSRLSQLPSDLFQGTVPEIRKLHIVNTRIEYIPEMLFSNIKNLLLLNLKNNHIKQIEKKHFQGIQSLRALYIDQNQLRHLDEDFFDFLKNLTRLEMQRNNLRDLPKSFSNLSKLKALTLSSNSLTQMKENDCLGLSNLYSLNLLNNKITHIHPQCFSYWKNVNDIDISGNSFDAFPEKPILMERVRTFVFNHNSMKCILNITRFLVSKTLETLKMSNSSIASIQPDVLHDLPNIQVMDLSANCISHLPEDFFSHNSKLREIFLQGNQISSLPPNLIQSNPVLTSLNISSNHLTQIPPEFFEENKDLILLDLSNNILKEMPLNFSGRLRSVTTLSLSNNSIVSLVKEYFFGLNKLKNLILSYNSIEQLTNDTFLPFKANGPLDVFNREGIFEPYMPAGELKLINLSHNKLTHVEDGVFHYLHNLEILILSNNNLSHLNDLPLITFDQKLSSLDLSFNKFLYIPEKMLSEAQNLRFLDLSGNRLTHFYMRWVYKASTLHEINLSKNNLHFFGEKIEHIPIKLSYSSVKVLNLSNNQLSFNYTSWLYDQEKRTWGRASPFILLSKIEELHLSNNLIDTIFMDWRNELSQLRILDLRKNKFTYLTHQELLFSSVKIYENKSIVPHPCSHSLTVDLRENEIRGVDLPHQMLKKLPRKNESIGLYGHATILLDDNRYICGCGLMNFLRLLDNDVVLTSELYRVEGKNWMQSAKINVGNLSCWEPLSVRGKLLEAETWIHHLVPLFGMCTLIDFLPQ